MNDKKKLDTKNDKAWQILFETHDIVDDCHKNGFYEISADDIKKVREPRLMTKFDHYNNLPTQFKDENLVILPNRRGNYVIGNFDVYKELKYEENIKPEIVSFPHSIDTINPKVVTSESVALNVAHISRMLSKLANNENLDLTVTGRMSSGTFSYDVLNKTTNTNYNFGVEKSQIEIDGSYESKNHFLIVESKMHTADDFMARQLYYPFRTLQTRTNKKITPIFFTLSNDVYSFFIYDVADINNYNSLQLVKQVNFMFNHKSIIKDDLINIYKNASEVPEPLVPFPQADNFERVIDLLNLLVEKDLTFEEITLNYAFTSRQTAYYTNAGIYLSLIEKFTNEDNEIAYRITKKGLDIIQKEIKEKYLSLADEIISHKPFYLAFKHYIKNNEVPNKSETVNYMKQCNIYNIGSDVTRVRRSSTIRGWIRWIANLTEEISR